MSFTEKRRKPDQNRMIRIDKKKEPNPITANINNKAITIRTSSNMSSKQSVSTSESTQNTQVLAFSVFHVTIPSFDVCYFEVLSYLPSGNTRESDDVHY